MLGKDDEDPMTDIRSTLPHEWMKDIVTYGLPGVAGMDFSGSLSIEVPRNWKDIIGVPYSIYDDTEKMLKDFGSGNTYRGIADSPITPIVVRNAMRGAELYFFGQRTRGGRDINYPGVPGPKKITGAEALKKGVLGLQPTSVSKGYKAYKATQKMKDSVQTKKTKWVDQFVNALRRGKRTGDFSEAKRIGGKINEWNEKARVDKKPHRILDMNEAISNRLDPNNGKNIPKQMRPKAMGIAGEWGGRPMVRKRAIGGER